MLRAERRSSMRRRESRCLGSSTYSPGTRTSPAPAPPTPAVDARRPSGYRPAPWGTRRRWRAARYRARGLCPRRPSAPSGRAPSTKTASSPGPGRSSTRGSPSWCWARRHRRAVVVRPRSASAARAPSPSISSWSPTARRTTCSCPTSASASRSPSPRSALNLCVLVCLVSVHGRPAQPAPRCAAAVHHPLRGALPHALRGGPAAAHVSGGREALAGPGRSCRGPARSLHPPLVLGHQLHPRLHDGLLERAGPLEAPRAAEALRRAARQMPSSTSATGRPRDPDGLGGVLSSVVNPEASTCST